MLGEARKNESTARDKLRESQTRRDDLKKRLDSAIQDRKTARDVATRVVLAFIANFTSARLEAVQQFENAATFVSEAGR